MGRNRRPSILTPQTPHRLHQLLPRRRRTIHIRYPIKQGYPLALQAKAPPFVNKYQYRIFSPLKALIY